MRTPILLIAIGAVLFTAGCIEPFVFLHPLFTKMDAVTEPTLGGLWAVEGGEVTWAFQESGKNSYDLLWAENGKVAKFRAHLGRLGESLFLDISPISHLEAGVTAPSLAHMIPVHSIWRVSIEGDVLRLAILVVKPRMIAPTDGAAGMAYEELDWGIVVTAPTQELQEFVLRHAEDAEAFSGPTIMHRQD